MKKRAIIIASSDPKLSGVKKDLLNIQSFLTGMNGGAWLENEIITLIQPRKDFLENHLQRIKSESNDFLLVVFTGHGGHKRGETYIEVNDNELISQSKIENLALRQLNIYDCCRVDMMAEMEKSALLFESTAGLCSYDDKYFSMEDIRQLYNDRVMKAQPQQLNLYSCSLNQCSLDTSDGGLYLTNLIEYSSKESSDRFKTAVECHLAIEDIVYNESMKIKDGLYPQKPSCTYVRFNREDKYLPLSINPIRYI